MLGEHGERVRAVPKSLYVVSRSRGHIAKTCRQPKNVRIASSRRPPRLKLIFPERPRLGAAVHALPPPHGPYVARKAWRGSETAPGTGPRHVRRRVAHVTTPERGGPGFCGDPIE
jgi:hypothetical protein